MAELLRVHPAVGPSGGGDLVRLAGTGFGADVAVRFGGAPAAVVAVHDGPSGERLLDVHTPAHAPGIVDVVAIDIASGDAATLHDSYEFERLAVGAETALSMVVRTLLRALSRDVLEATRIAVSVDYREAGDDGVHIIPIAPLPALVLSGLRIRENRVLTSNVVREDPVGNEVELRAAGLTVDLTFTVTGAADRVADLLSLVSAIATFATKRRWLAVPRDSADPSAGVVRFELDLDGDFRTRLDGPDDIRVFSVELVVRGVEIAAGLSRGRTRPVETPRLFAEPMPPGDIS